MKDLVLDIEVADRQTLSFGVRTSVGGIGGGGQNEARRGQMVMANNRWDVNEDEGEIPSHGGKVRRKRGSNNVQEETGANKKKRRLDGMWEAMKNPSKVRLV